MSIDHWIRNKSDEAAVDAGCYFDHDKADRVRRFFEKFLRHSKGDFAGKPFTLLTWQWERIIAPLYGWRKADGRRRFTKAGVGVPKKNGKSTMLSGIALYHLLGDNEPGAEVYSAAASRDQASIIYNEAAAMVEASPLLMRRLDVVRSKKVLSAFGDNSIYQALSRDVPTKEGLNISCLLFDELHAQPDRKLWDTLRYGGAARREPMLVWISTAGCDKGTLGYEQWSYAKDIQDSRIVDISYLPCIYETPADADWTQESVWKAANPSYGETLNSDSFEEDCREAQRTPSSENSFKRYRLNVWTEAESRWLSSASWQGCKRSITPETLRQTECIVGLDLSTTQDITAGCAVFRVGSAYRMIPRFWVPRETLTIRERNNQVRLDQWAHAGLIEVTEKPSVDYTKIREWVNGLASDYKVREVAIDPWNATQVATDLVEDGFEVTYVRTGFASISAATKEFEKLVLTGEMQHDGNPVLAWMLANVVIETDASGNIKISKKKSSEKIDGVMAIILALARWTVAVAKKKSKYSTSRLEGA